MTPPLTILCLASYEKGFDFLREAKDQGCRVLLLTSASIADRKWPDEAIDETFYMPDDNHKWNRDHTILAVSHLAKTQQIDRIVPLDDFDLEIAASLREHLRIPGMGETTTRYFRDKLAMRARALDAGLPVPEFVQVLNRERLSKFMRDIPAPWVLKPRSQAGAVGIKKIHSEQELWDAADTLGDQQSFYLLERYLPGEVFHVDTIWDNGELLFSVSSRYGAPPMDVSHGGGVFSSRTLPRESPQSQALIDLNQRVLKAFGLVRGVSHSEFIRSKATGEFFFLETAARVGGANLADMINAATGVNLWREWAKVEIAGGKQPYAPPTSKNGNAGILVSLSRYQHPDTSEFNDPEIVWRMAKDYHIGLVVRSESAARVEELLTNYAQRIAYGYLAVAPAPEQATH